MSKRSLITRFEGTYRGLFHGNIPVSTWLEGVRPWKPTIRTCSLRTHIEPATSQLYPLDRECVLNLTYSVTVRVSPIRVIFPSNKHRGVVLIRRNVCVHISSVLTFLYNLRKKEKEHITRPRIEILSVYYLSREMLYWKCKQWMGGTGRPVNRVCRYRVCSLVVNIVS